MSEGGSWDVEEDAMTRTWSISVGVLSVCLATSSQPSASPGETIRRSSGVITVGGTPYPYLAEGTGPSCIVVGTAPIVQPLFSETLKRHVRFIFVDFKRTWGADALQNAETITMETLADEVDEVRRSLGLDRVCLVGHSVPGLIVLEYAAKYPQRISEGILIGVPPYFSREIPKMRSEFWERDASPDRKAIQQQNVQRLSDATLRTLSPRDAFAFRYVRTAPHYFYDASYDFSWAWLGRQFSAEFLNMFFARIVADYDPRPRLSNNTVPLFVALGRYDYAVPYYMWDGMTDKIPRLTIQRFEQSGHFAMLEEPSAFDDRVVKWLERSK